ncbi:MAG: hypothetical protein WA210_15910 [Burkholderiaceae bacterium]
MVKIKHVKRKPVPVKKVIWRMSGNSPLGEYVSARDSSVPSDATVQAGAAPVSQSSWRLSSVELRDGLHVTEQPLDTLPGELLDEFFKHSR